MESIEFVNGIHELRLQVLLLSEEVGGMAGLLREAESDEKNAARESSQMCLDDVLPILESVVSIAEAIERRVLSLMQSRQNR